MRLGISSYTYVWAVGVPGFPQPHSPLGPLGLLDKATALDVRVVQVADNLPLDGLPASDVQRLAETALERGIAMEIGTAGIVLNHLLHYLQLAVQLRSPLLRTVIDTASHQPSPEDALAALRKVLPHFVAAGVCLAIENHDRFPATTLAHIIEELNSPHVGICLDTANSLGCGEDLHTVLRSLGPHVVNLHVKDFKVQRLPHQKGFTVVGCPAGRGVLDVPRLLADLRAWGRDPNVILELWPPPEATAEASIAKEAAWTQDSIRYLRQLVIE